MESEQARPQQGRANLEIRVAKTRCPFCHDEIAHGVEPLVCPQCHALHHRECLVEPGRCATCATPYLRNTVTATAPQAVTAAPQAVTAATRPGGTVSFSRDLGHAVGFLGSQLPSFLVTSTIVHSISAVVALLAAANGPQVALRLAWAAASVLGILAGWRTRRSAAIWATFSGFLATFLLVWPHLVHDVSWSRAEITCDVWGGLLASFAVLLGAFLLRPSGRRSGEKSAPEKEKV